MKDDDSAGVKSSHDSDDEPYTLTDLPLADHVHVGLNEDGEPVRVYPDINDAREAVESDAYRHEDVADYWPDVPLMEEVTTVE